VVFFRLEGAVFFRLLVLLKRCSFVKIIK